MLVTYNGRRLRVATNLAVAPEDWNPKKQEYRGNGNEVENKNRTLNNFKSLTEKKLIELRSKGFALIPRVVKATLLNTLFPEKIKMKDKLEDQDMYTFVNWYIETNPNKVSHGTMKSY